jgi:hypothetical protein
MVSEIEFKKVVLQHIENVLGQPEWLRLRALAKSSMRKLHKDIKVNENASARELVDEATSEDGISSKEIMSAYSAATFEAIGQIAGCPVYYIDGEGVYFWSADPEKPSTRVLWLTHPAYPSRW